MERTLEILESVIDVLRNEGYNKAADVLSCVLDINVEVDYLDDGDWKEFDVDSYVGEIADRIESIKL